MSIIRFRSFFLGVAAVLVVASAIVVAVFGFRLSTEFTGGTVVGIHEQGYDISDVRETLASFDATVIPVDDTVFEVRIAGDSSDPAIVQALTARHADASVVYETSVGPSLGRELMRKSLIALALVLVAILGFVAYAFSGINEARSKYGLGPSSWVYGVSALIALLHDVLIPSAIFIILGKEITSLYVVGMLSILGLSVSDTIVVFDRIRERMIHAHGGETFASLVDKSIHDTIARSISTSLTLVLVLGALLAFGPSATHDLALVMLLGAIFGTYSSIFVASPLLTLFSGVSRKK